jgi:hypothetical protein
LNNDDVVDGGLGKDTVTASVTGLTSTTGALRIANVETITLTTGGNNSLNLAGVTGATSVSVSAATQTITGLDLATKLIATGAALLTVTGANETGADDTLTVEQMLDGDVSNTITTAATLENLSIILNDTGATANTATFVLTDAVAKKITVAEAADTVTTGENVVLGTLNKSVTTVDTSGVKGTQAFSVANTLTAATLSLSGAAVATVTGTGVNDTINVTSTAAVTHVIDAGAGTADVVNIAVKTGFINVGSITNAETINVTVAAGNSIDLTGAGSASFATSARAVNILGGNSASTFNAQTVVTEVTSVNAGTFGGNLLATFGNDVFDSTVTVTGGALATDKVSASYTAAATYTPKASGVEILAISAGNNATAESFVLDLSGTTGVVTVEVYNVSSTAVDTVTIDKMTNQKIVVTGSAATANIVEAKLADASGTTDSVSIELKNATGPTIVGSPVLKTTDIETINLKVSGLATSVSLASLAMTDTTKFESLVVTGDKALTVTAVNANVTSIDASGMTTGGSFIQTGRSQTTAANYVGSLGDDTFLMRNAADVINGAAGTDTLKISGNLILGGIQVDLSATGDQVTSFNGSANAAIQSGFENVDLSGITGNFAADITGSKTTASIVGTSNGDQINTASSVTTTQAITGGLGADTITLGSHTAAVTIILGATGVATGSDTLTGFQQGAGKDIIQLPTAMVAAGLEQATGAFSGAISAFTIADIGEVAIAGKAVVYSATAATLVDTTAEIAALIGAAGAGDGTTAIPFSLVVNGKAIIVAGTGTTAYVYYVENDATVAVTSTEVTLVGTYTVDTAIGSFNADNFTFV